MSIFKMLSGFNKSDKNGSEDELNSLKLSAIKELDLSDHLSDLVIESAHTKSREQIIHEINKDVYQSEQ